MIQKTAVFKSFILPAIDSSQIWRLTGSTVVCFVCWALVAKLFKLLFFSNATTLELISGNTKTGMLFILLSFWGLLLGTFLITKLNKRSFRSLFGTEYRLKKYFSITFILCFLFGLVSTCLIINVGKKIEAFQFQH